MQLGMMATGKGRILQRRVYNAPQDRVTDRPGNEFISTG
ncbi:MAG: hypothetical protein H6Q96_418, partial [Nitrospirae bacterium]|nr:hypothetical protein [Nitrospirota bacterium]